MSLDQSDLHYWAFIDVLILWPQPAMGVLMIRIAMGVLMMWPCFCALTLPAYHKSNNTRGRAEGIECVRAEEWTYT